MRLDSKAWNGRVAQVIEAIGHEEFSDVLLQALEELVPYDCSMIVEFKKNTAPVILADHLLSSERRYFDNIWLNGGYLLGPYYNAYLRGIPNGFYSLKQVAPDAFTKSEYYRIYFRHVGQSDMAGFVAWPTPEQCIILNPTRAHYNSRFSSMELSRFRAIEPVVNAAMMKHWRKTGKGKKETTFHSQLLKRASLFGRQVLSDREYEVLHYVLRGHSTKSIAHELSVTTDTVHAHRKHTYRKLGVRSQGELFSIYLAHLSAEGQP